jgi:hypothetical protein
VAAAAFVAILDAEKWKRTLDLERASEEGTGKLERDDDWREANS